ncbi:OB-fold domain-containing protein, partial [Sphingomonas sp. 66-10]
RGTIHSFVIMHQPQLPCFDYPLPVVLVELEEGVRIVANMLGATADEVAIGKPVTLDFVEVEPDYILPAFRLA